VTKAQALAIRRTADGDMRWFIDHPERSYRVRLASPAEVEMQRRSMDMQPIPAGFRVFACIWQIEPHSRCTALCLGEATNDADGASEEKAATLFLLAASRAASATTH
jgi:hypothetical protein